MRIGEAEGLVERVDLRTTHIRDTSGGHHIIRNGSISEVMNGLGVIAASELPYRTVTKGLPGAHLAVTRQLRRPINDVFDKRGVEIPYPCACEVAPSSTRGPPGQARAMDSEGVKSRRRPCKIGARLRDCRHDPPWNR